MRSEKTTFTLSNIGGVRSATVRSVLLEIVPLVALIWVKPPASVEASPVLFIVAIPVFEESHVTVFVIISVEVSEYIPVAVYWFDVLYKDGQSLIDTPYQKRREILEQIISQDEMNKIIRMRIAETPEELDVYFMEWCKNVLWLPKARLVMLENGAKGAFILCQRWHNALECNAGNQRWHF